MANIRTIPLSFGHGLDRSSGVTEASPYRFEDLRNVHLRNGRVEMRLGLERRLTVPQAGAVLAIQYIDATQQAAVLTLNGSTVDLHLCDIQANGSLDIVTTFRAVLNVGTSVARAPIVTVADSFDKLFITHNEVIYSQRDSTKLIDISTLADPVPLELLEVDAVSGPQIHFRGVRAYLEYLLGWGYGNDVTADRAEILRISLPGLPDTFRPEHYIAVGRTGDPILDVQPAGESALIFKSAEFYRLVGYDRSTFGAFPVDSIYGLLAPRLAVTVGGICYFWSLEGPRMSSGGPSEDLALPLELRRRLRTTVEMEDRRQGFVTYVPHRREIEWVFGQLSYVYSLDRREWTFNEYASKPLGCAGILRVLERSDERDSASTRIPRAKINALACAPDDVIRPRIQATSCDTTLSATAEMVRPVPYNQRIQWAIFNPPKDSLTYRAQTVLGDACTPQVKGWKTYLDWRKYGRFLSAAEMGTAVQDPPTNREMIQAMCTAFSTAHTMLNPTYRDSAWFIPTADTGSSGGTNRQMWNEPLAGEASPGCGVTAYTGGTGNIWGWRWIKDYGLITMTGVVSRTEISAYWDTSSVLHSLGPDSALSTDTKSTTWNMYLGFRFKIVPSLPGASAYIRYKLKGTGTWTNGTSQPVDVAGTVIQQQAVGYVLYAQETPLDDRPAWVDDPLVPVTSTAKTTWENRFAEYDYEVVLTYPGVANSTIKTGTARVYFVTTDHLKARNDS